MASSRLATVCQHDPDSSLREPLGQGMKPMCGGHDYQPVHPRKCLAACTPRQTPTHRGLASSDPAKLLPGRFTGALECLSPFPAEPTVQPSSSSSSATILRMPASSSTTSTRVMDVSPVEHQPIEPSIWRVMSRFSSTAYSMGSSLVNWSKKPLTMRALAATSVSPRLCK